MPAHEFEPTKEILDTTKSAMWNDFLRNLDGINNLTHETVIAALT